MVRKDHIEKMNLIGEMLGSSGEGLAIVTINAGVEYAKRLATDEALRAEIAATFNPSLAARDFRRARKVVEKYSYRPLKPSPNAASRPSVKVAPPKAAALTPEQIQDCANMKLIPHEDFMRLVKAGQWTPDGRASFLAGLPQSNDTLEDKLRPLIPYLDMQYGFITFARVHSNIRQIDGKPVKELLEQAGLIDRKNNLTDKGKVWFNISCHSGEVEAVA